MLCAVFVSGSARTDGWCSFITRRNWLTRPLIGRWWQSSVYSAEELRVAFRQAGFAECTFRGFPPAARYLALSGYIIEARH
jgi:hypothetical protein